MVDNLYVRERRFFQKHAALCTALEKQYVHSICKLNPFYELGSETDAENEEWEDEEWDFCSRYAFVLNQSVLTITCCDETIALEQDNDFSNGKPNEPLKWVAVYSDINDKISRVVPHYNEYTGHVDGVTFIFTTRSLTLFFWDEWLENEPTPKYILRKRAREILGKMRTQLSQISDSADINDERKAFERIPEMKNLPAMMGCHRLNWTYNPYPGQKEISDILVELTLICGGIDPNPILNTLYRYSERCCLDTPNCLVCPLWEYCEKQMFF